MTGIIRTEDKLRCAERELKMRQRVYPRWIEADKMSTGKAAHEIACMEAIVADYRKQFEAAMTMAPGTRVRRRDNPDDIGTVLGLSEPDWNGEVFVQVRWDIGDYVTNISPDKLEAILEGDE